MCMSDLVRTSLGTNNFVIQEPYYRLIYTIKWPKPAGVDICLQK